MTWNADSNVIDANTATSNSGITADVFSWWCNNGGGSVAGIAYTGGLCSIHNTNLNEKQSSAADSGFVSYTPI